MAHALICALGYECPGCGAEIGVAVLPLVLVGRVNATCLSSGAKWEAAKGGDGGAPSFTRLA